MLPVLDTKKYEKGHDGNMALEKSLQQLFDEFIIEAEYSTRLRPATILGYKNAFRLFVNQMPEISTTRELTPVMMNEFFKRLHIRLRKVGRDTIKKGVKNSTIKTHYSKLNVFFEWLKKKRYIEENPLCEIKSPSVSYKDFRRLKDEEIRRIYSAISLHSSNSFILRRDTMMVSILLFCGLRLGEFISLKITDIDLEKAILVVRGETSKSKDTRSLKMHPALILHLKDYLKERNARRLKTEYLIASNKNDKGLTRDGLKHWVKSMIKKSGVRFHLHQLRHTFACKLAEADVNLSKIQKMMGHVDVQMTSKYTRSMRAEDMGEDIRKISID